jgi:serine protease Do
MYNIFSKISNDESKRLLYFILFSIVIVTVIFVVREISLLIPDMIRTTVREEILKQNRKLNPVIVSPVMINESPTESAIVDVVKKVNPSIVSIIVTKDLPKLTTVDPFNNFLNDDFFKDFRINVPREAQEEESGTEKKEIGGGTGFVISKDGLILTNKHVVIDEVAEYTVVMSDNKKYPAKVLARDTINDLAVIKIDVKDLVVAPLGDSSVLQLGQTVIAIGNSLGEFRNTVSKGVISGLSRSIRASSGFGKIESLSGVIQTDAAINSGNSGGPLLNLKGEVIGINTAVALGAQNVGFAIPINKAKQTIQSIVKHGKIVRPFLGVRYVLINKIIAKNNQLQFDYGALVVRGEKSTDLAVVPGSPADKAGITENTIILEIDGQKITEENSVGQVISNSIIGKEISLKILQQGKERVVKTKLIESK